MRSSDEDLRSLRSRALGAPGKRLSVNASRIAELTQEVMDARRFQYQVGRALGVAITDGGWPEPQPEEQE